ncbi:MAG: ATP-binding cassette domain-containing protein, partial [Bacteroidota bacterium]
MAEQAVISFENVTVRFDNRIIFRDLDFRLERGEFAYLIGATGSGKSSFLKLIYRDLMPVEGRVHVAGIDVTSLSERKVPELRRNLGIVFQDFQLLPDR